MGFVMKVMEWSDVLRLKLMEAVSSGASGRI